MNKLYKNIISIVFTVLGTWVGASCTYAQYQCKATIYEKSNLIEVKLKVKFKKDICLFYLNNLGKKSTSTLANTKIDTSLEIGVVYIQQKDGEIKDLNSFDNAGSFCDSLNASNCDGSPITHCYKKGEAFTLKFRMQKTAINVENEFKIVIKVNDLTSGREILIVSNWVKY